MGWFFGVGLGFHWNTDDEDKSEIKKKDLGYGKEDAKLELLTFWPEYKLRLNWIRREHIRFV